MQSCYHSEIEFFDPAFGRLKGAEAKAMWHMLLAGNTELTIEFKNIQASDERGSCSWGAIYKFPATGRTVHNKVRAQFLFKDGLIVSHADTFSFWRWARMAFGVKGLFLGWTPFFRNKVKAVLRNRLTKFVQDNPVYRQG